MCVPLRPVPPTNTIGGDLGASIRLAEAATAFPSGAEVSQPRRAARS